MNLRPALKGRKPCAECERVLPIAEFRRCGYNHYSLCRICYGLKQRATEGPPNATKEDSRYVGSFPDTTSQVWQEKKHSEQGAKKLRRSRKGMRGVDIDAIHRSKWAR